MSTNDNLFRYTIRLADNNFILGHRLSEWCGHGPILEEDIAITNIALDKLGAAKALYEYAASVEGKGRTEDDLAFLRNEREFMNTLLVEQPNGDYACTIIREWFNDVFDLLYYTALLKSADETLAGIAAKSVKELQYHVRHTGQWVLRFGEGTEESHQRAQNAIDELWPYTGERFEMDETDHAAVKSGYGVDASALQSAWMKQIREVCQQAGLSIPENSFQHSGSRKGVHTEHLGFILAQCQYLPRTMPEAKW